MKILALLTLFYLVGCCCPICNSEVHYGPSGKPFPANWGKPPEVQTKDYRPLPYGYGSGSSTLYHWIIENKEKEFQHRLNNLPKTGTI